MKKLLLLGFVAACSTPVYVVKYQCSPEAKARLADVANTCVGNVKKQGKQEVNYPSLKEGAWKATSKGN